MVPANCCRKKLHEKLHFFEFLSPATAQNNPVTALTPLLPCYCTLLHCTKRNNWIHWITLCIEAYTFSKRMLRKNWTFFKSWKLKNLAWLLPPIKTTLNSLVTDIVHWNLSSPSHASHKIYTIYQLLNWLTVLWLARSFHIVSEFS